MDKNKCTTCGLEIEVNKTLTCARNDCNFKPLTPPNEGGEEAFEKFRKEYHEKHPDFMFGNILKQGYDAGFLAGRSSNVKPEMTDEWIEFNEMNSRPNENGWYNCSCKFDNGNLEAFTLYWNGENWCLFNDFSVGEELFTLGFGVEVTHFQPLPSPPQAE